MTRRSVLAWMNFNIGQPLLNSSRHSRSMSKEMRILSLTLKSPRKAKIYLLLIEHWAKICRDCSWWQSRQQRELMNWNNHYREAMSKRILNIGKLSTELSFFPSPGEALKSYDLILIKNWTLFWLRMFPWITIMCFNRYPNLQELVWKNNCTPTIATESGHKVGPRTNFPWPTVGQSTMKTQNKRFLLEINNSFTC